MKSFMAASTIAKRARPLSFRYSTRARSTPAFPQTALPGSTKTVTGRPPRISRTTAPYSAGDGGVSSRYRIPSPPPTSTSRIPIPSPASSSTRAATRRSASRNGSREVICEPMWQPTPVIRRDRIPAPFA